MKKIVLASDSTHFPEGAFAFASHLNKIEPILLTGIFLPQINYANVWSYSGGLTDPAFIPYGEEEDESLIQQNIDSFENLCRQNTIAYRVHKDYNNFTLHQFIAETRFADLLVISSETFYDNFGSTDPNPSLEDAVHTSECPVTIVPEKFNFPNKNILAYDGSASSVYAIKQFAYLFPALADNETVLVFANEDKGTPIPNEESAVEWLTQHFKNLTIQKLNMDGRKYFTSWVTQNDNAIVISGAYGRSLISQMFRKSFMMDVIGAHKLPVFMAHK